jgi:hypothetical protein
MGLLKALRKTANLINKKQDTLFTFDIEKQKSYLIHFREPVDDIERGYYQYKCQMKLMGIVLKVLLNIGFFFPLLVYLIMLRPSSKLFMEQRVDALFLSNDIDRSILPEALLRKYLNITFGNNEDGLNLNSKDRIFIFKIIKRYPFSFFFVFKCLLKISMYSSRIQSLNPKAIITYAEYSFTSSVLTAYCEEYNLEHINVMHGEKLFNIRDSFFHFHKCYIWDDYYKNLFFKLRADLDQFEISVPKTLKFGKDIIVRKTYDYTYYLGSELKDEMITIAFTLKKLSEKGYKVAIRPHPRYTDFQLVNDIFRRFEIEDYKRITIKESILRTRFAISLYSTVLNQANYNGVGIIIDDVTNPCKYKKLVELEYICLNKVHKLLSQEVN